MCTDEKIHIDDIYRQNFSPEIINYVMKILYVFFISNKKLFTKTIELDLTHFIHTLNENR